MIRITRTISSAQSSMAPTSPGESGIKYSSTMRISTSVSGHVSSGCSPVFVRTPPTLFSFRPISGAVFRCLIFQQTLPYFFCLQDPILSMIYKYRWVGAYAYQQKQCRPQNQRSNGFMVLVLFDKTK